MLKKTRRAGLIALAAFVLGLIASQPLAAQDVRPTSGVPREYLWFSASAALFSTSIGGLFAVRVHTLYDEALALPSVSPQRLVLRDRTARAEVTADCLFGAALLMAATSVVLALFTDWSGPALHRQEYEQARWQFVPIASTDGARLTLRGVLP
ncbi:MAG TPA: hypothetical protein VHZ95_22380 [Polyangiales bacterium]|nr:hypothetical protein [Polyangiales bacterium]